MKFGPPVPGYGPPDARICIVAEAPGDKESEGLRPLIGPTGYALRQMLSTIGVNLDACYRTNVFSCQPGGNNIALYGVDRGGCSGRAFELGPLTTNPITYIADEHLHHLDRLRSELAAVDPHIVIALGNTAAWALLGQQGIGTLRGSVYTSNFLGTRPLKVLPTYHPAAIFRQYDLRNIIIADLEKAHNEAASPDFNYDNTELWLNPTIDDLALFDERYMRHATECGSDIETKRGQITAISFAPVPEVSLCIPFWIEGPQPHYWSEPDEIIAWGYARKWIERADLTKVGQNFLYDLQYLAGPYRMKPRACTEDTMLASHSRWSEMQKGLGFLGSVHCNVPSWKSMRTFRREEILKRDD